MATVDEMSHTLGVTFTSAKSGTPDGPNGCWYEGRDADGSDIAVQVNVFDLAQFDSVKSSQCTGGALPPVQRPGLGVAAVECTPDLFVQVDAERGIKIYSDTGGEDGRVKIAELVLPRIRGLT